MIFCPNCGKKSNTTDIFCETCGENLANQTMISQFSSDDIIAGHFVTIIQKQETLSFDQANSLIRSEERTDRIFAKLERTGNFQIDKINGKFFLKPISAALTSIKNDHNISSPSKIDQGKFKQLKDLLDLGKIDLEKIPDIMNIEWQLSQKLVEKLLDQGIYRIETNPNNGKEFIHKIL